MFEVVDIVSRQDLHDAFDGFFAALGMHAVVLPLFGREHLVERQIRFAQDAELLQGFARVALAVMSGDNPGILIEGLDGSTRSAENRANPPANGDFHIGEMRDDFRDRPLRRRRALAQLGGRGAADQARQLFRCRGLHFQGILAREFALDPLHVLLNRFFHFDNLSDQTLSAS